MKKNLGMLAIALVAGLAGCNQSAPPAVASAPVQASKPMEARVLSLQELRQNTHGFSVGPLTSAHEIYVFFDPQCPHCAMFWQEAKKLPGVRVTWVPVGVLRAASGTQAAALLQAADPVAAMDQHAADIQKPANKPADLVINPEVRRAVDANTTLFKSLGVNQVPILYLVNGAKGTVTQQLGGAPASLIAAKLGVRPGVAGGSN